MDFLPVSLDFILDSLGLCGILLRNSLLDFKFNL